jgi:tRNA pseudouridine55 synthase
MISGVLLVNKIAGPTSHDVVARIRRLLPRKTKVGHAGTLDPFATGLLVVVIGKATAASRFLTSRNKRYEAVIHFGEQTDTLDSTGRVTSSSDAPFPSRAAIENALIEMVGPHFQLPPMYSAKKIDGKPLYKLARNGVEVEREQKLIEVMEASLIDAAPPKFTVDFRVSKGTYVRVLAADLSCRLGGVGHLSALTRLESGIFSLSEAHTLEQIQEMKDNNGLEKLLISVNEALSDYSLIIVDAKAAKDIAYGKIPDSASMRIEKRLGAGEMVRLIDESGNLLAMGRTLIEVDASTASRMKSILRFEKVFIDPDIL